MTPNERPTPLTDAEEWQYTNEDGEEWSLVESDFARTLEQMLAERTEERDTALDKLAKCREALEASSGLLSVVNTGSQPDVGQMNWYDARSIQLLANRQTL